MRLQILTKNYIKTEGFSKDPWAAKIAEAEEIRHASDYDDFYIATREEAEEQILTAEELIDCIEKFVRGKNSKRRKPAFAVYTRSSISASVDITARAGFYCRFVTVGPGLRIYCADRA